MGLCSSKEMIKEASKNKKGVCAFAVHHFEMMKGVLAAAEEENVPVILQTTPATILYLGIPYIVQSVRVLADSVQIPVALHLDHGDSFETVMACIRGGYTSVMIDGSHLSFEENIALVKKTVDACRPVGIPVEAELGSIFRNEEEEDMRGGENRYFTDPELAGEFAVRTGIDFLAPAFGTIHGEYKKPPSLDYGRIERIAQLTKLPLVMHGASGLSDDAMKKAAECGISKVNFSTELKMAFAEELRSFLLSHEKECDPRKYFLTAREKVKEIAGRKMALLFKKEALQ
ncbi:class II fructose-bisphosphate aldolase [Metabacillus sp. GX 13764]|uniref:class II fructose-bisphosphate aldolase n=1 Tax=Metabacillus kandeliae TaxID=2900151 RepID=UPI001E5CD039|nr:class II fructose-bisphosphate aldolase [Metabacillus kandeliae]MCD7032976.1 class II fructose-bisphosphate aldolase [Metabacillus kandeliae]